MKYQLVLQLGDSSKAAFETLVGLEDALTEELGEELGYVDGHDWGSGTANIFIHTDDPESAFERIKSIHLARKLLPQLTVAYREFEKDDWMVLHPAGVAEFDPLKPARRSQ